MGNPYRRRREPARSAVIVTVRGAGVMTPSGRRDVATWLRKTARDLESYGDRYAMRFTARYRYR